VNAEDIFIYVYVQFIFSCFSSSVWQAKQQKIVKKIKQLLNHLYIPPMEI